MPARSTALPPYRTGRTARVAGGGPGQLLGVGAGCAARLAAFSRDLAARHPDVPEVAGFREHARDYVRKAAPTRVGDL